MQGDQQKPLGAAQSKLRKQFGAADHWRSAREIEAGRADVEDEVRILSHLDDAAPVGLRRDEMQARHLGDGMADRIVEGAGSHLATMDVRDRNVQQRGGNRSRQDFEAVAEHDQHIRRKLRQRVRKAGKADAGAARHRLGTVVVELEVNSSGNREAVGFDGAPGLAEFRHQMHAAGDDAEVDVISGLQLCENAPQVPVVRPRTRDDGNASRAGHDRLRQGEASSMPCSTT